MDAPAFFDSDTRRRSLAWTDWAQIDAWLREQRACRVAINDGTWPYVLGMAYTYTGTAFVMYFSRNGRLASLLAHESHVTVEIDELFDVTSGLAGNTSASYASVIARCSATTEDIDIGTGTIVRMTAAIVLLSAKHRSEPSRMRTESEPV